MTAKEHYDNHLASFYGWMVGNFEEKLREQQDFFKSNDIFSTSSAVAVDLGAGHGLQSVSLARLGFNVIAVDFNKKLLDELQANAGDQRVKTVERDLLDYLQSSDVKASLMVCMGDTLTHLDGEEKVEQLVREIAIHLEPEGKV